MLVLSYVVLRRVLDALLWRHHAKEIYEDLNDVLIMVSFALVVELFSRISRLVERIGVFTYACIFAWHLALYSLVYEKAPAAELDASKELGIAGEHVCLLFSPAINQKQYFQC